MGCLHCAKCISKADSTKAYAYYKEQGWLEEIKKELQAVGIESVPDFMEPEVMFNVKFRFSRTTINYSNQPVIISEELENRNRYKLMDLEFNLKFKKASQNHTTYLSTDDYTRTTEGKTTNVNPLHKKIQNAVKEALSGEYEEMLFEQYSKNDYGQRIDIVGKSGEELHYFEVKTSNSAKLCIREALGQILEYANYPSVSKASKLFIIGAYAPDDQDKEYIKFLRGRYRLPIWYCWYSFEKEQLSGPIGQIAG